MYNRVQKPNPVFNKKYCYSAISCDNRSKRANLMSRRIEEKICRELKNLYEKINKTAKKVPKINETLKKNRKIHK